MPAVSEPLHAYDSHLYLLVMFSRINGLLLGFSIKYFEEYMYPVDLAAEVAPEDWKDL